MAATPPTPSRQRFTFDAEPHGSGGFARVIRGRDNDLERGIAVKVLTPLATAFSDAEQERFRREARILASLSHPNIPAIYDVKFGPDDFLIIFQFIEGETLRQVIQGQGPCQLSEVRVWFHQIASALEYAHRKGNIHRDVKPENIIITPDRETAYLVDFGIALSAEEARKLTGSGYVVGTPGYMSPEQLAGEKVDPTSDIYSLAVTLYEILSGKPIPIAHYEPLSSANEAIPPEVDTLIQDCILPRERRLNSLKVFASRLGGALRATKPLSDVLARGRLHELTLSIEPLSDIEFAKLPEGQRALILAKLADIVESGDPKLDFACEQLLALLLTRGVLLNKEDYVSIVKPSIAWGFERKFNGFQGRPSLQRALEEAAYVARGEAHSVLKQEFGDYLGKLDYGDREDWYLHAVREVLEALLANPAATEGTTPLVTALRGVNKLQRSRQKYLFPE